jgi:D-sedoheptulose 7-phosphate isomerase
MGRSPNKGYKMNNLWLKTISEHLDVIKLLAENRESIDGLQKIAEIVVETYRSGGKLLICGNGGSAADAQHIATEFVSKFLKERRALDAEALTTNTSCLTAIGNDYSFEHIFARQVEAKGRKGDVLIAISTSGNAKNVVAAVKIAKEIGMKTIALTGNNTNSLLCTHSDYSINIPSNSTPRIQEAHIMVGHMICDHIEKNI